MASRRIFSLILVPVCFDLILNSAGSEIQNFPLESCQTEVINQVKHEEFYPLSSYTKPGGFVEIKVRFRGVADGGIALSQNKNMSLPYYLLAFGSYNNQRSEIRKSSDGRSFERNLPFNTPGIMSQYQFRGFIIRYNSRTGTISASSEGNEMPLMSWKDPNPLNVTHYSFSTWTNRIILVAFNCKNRTSKGILSGNKNFQNFEKFSQAQREIYLQRLYAHVIKHKTKSAHTLVWTDNESNTTGFMHALHRQKT